MSAFGPKPKCRDVRHSVAIGWKADMKRTSQIGRLPTRNGPQAREVIPVSGWGASSQWGLVV